MQHQRKDYRLKNYDYSSPNTYFITICIKDKHPWLWQKISRHNVGASIARPSEETPLFEYELSPYGEVAQQAIYNIVKIYPCVSVDNFVIIPNHIHLLITVNYVPDTVAPKIPTVIRQMKGYVTKQIGFSPWQKLYHDHIIRNEEDYLNHWQYIDNNPANWESDDEYVNLQVFLKLNR